MSLWKRLSNVARGALLLRRRQQSAVHPEVENLKPAPAPEPAQPPEPDPAVDPSVAPEVPPTPKKRRL
ncbi:MAG: hypothetical protein KTR31_21435 [Myxococcales bacterium]|nr:hypothetical protein [Myxococcales bacterium]